MRGRPAKHKKLLEDPEVRRWYDQLAIDSINTANERLRELGRVCEWWNTTPSKLAALAKDMNGGRRAVEDMLMALMTQLAKRSPSTGRRTSPGYRKNLVKAVKSWLLHNDVALVRKIRVGDDGETPTIENERIPTRKELHSAFQAASDRGKVMVALCAFSGLRPEVLGMQISEDEMDGLRIRDIEGLKVDGGRVTFPIIPAMITVRRQLSKIKKRYRTFIGPQGCGCIKAYLERRMAKGEVLTPDSPVVRVGFDREKGGRPVGGVVYGSPFLTTSAIRSEIRAALRTQNPADGARQFRPYVLRSYADTSLEIAEREGKITPDDRKLFMGRRGDVDRIYTTGKGILPPEVIEGMRKEYAACAPYLETVAPPSGISVTSEQDQRVDELLERINRLERAVERAAVGKLEELGAHTAAEELRQLGEAGSRRR